MQFDLSRYRVKLAEEDVEREGAHRLRYRVFVEEMGAQATGEQAALRREWDASRDIASVGMATTPMPINME